MGMYTKINIIIKLKKETPKNIIEVIECMFNGYDIEDMNACGVEIPKHDFFENDRRVWFPKSCGSYYFTGTANSNIQYRNVDKEMVLHIDTDFKNYDDEIELFLDWIAPYVDAYEKEFLGYSRYEEDLNPTLYFYSNGKIIEFINNNVKGDKDD